MKSPLIQFQELIPSAHALEFIQQVFLSSPGIFATTGQAGTGKLILLLAIVQEFAKSGNPVTLITEKKDFPFVVPDNWTIHCVEPTESAWQKVMEQVAQQPPDALVIGSPSRKSSIG